MIPHSFLRYFFYPFFLKNNILFKVKPLGSLRVLLFHDFDDRLIPLFYSQLYWLSSFWSFISPQMFEGMMDGRIPIEGRNLLVTFDDGFKSNLKISKEVLEPLNIKAIFFVCSNFITQPTYESSKLFLKNHIQPCDGFQCIPDHWTNLSPDDIEYLIRHGHTIGAHTANHKRLTELSPSEAYYEMSNARQTLNSLFSLDVKHFAFPFGDSSSYSLEVAEMAQKLFPYIHTGFRGNNAIAPNPSLILRDSASYQNPSLKYGLFPNHHLAAFLEGSVDLIYRRSISAYLS